MYKVKIFVQVTSKENRKHWHHLEMTGFLPFVPVEGMYIETRQEGNGVQITQVTWNLELGLFNVLSLLRDHIIMQYPQDVIQAFRVRGWDVEETDITDERGVLVRLLRKT